MKHTNIQTLTSNRHVYLPTNHRMPLYPLTYNVSFLLKIKSILWLVGVKKKYSSILRLSLVVCGGAMTSYLRRIVPICNLNSKFARFIPAQLKISLIQLGGEKYFRGPVLKGRKLFFISLVSLYH